MEIFALIIIGVLSMMVSSQSCKGTEAPVEKDRKGK